MAEPKTSSLRGQAGRQARQRAQKEQDGDLETLVAELETRVDRLRASYDQYFMGIEKLPPHVQIKDVERRLQDLRKIQIRNTALRFKFQTTLQRYNTYQTYWQRIVRQIEEGTYKRDLRRAAERFGPGAPGARAGGREIEIDVELDELMSEEVDVDALLDDLEGPATSREPEPELAHDTLPPGAPEEPPLEMPVFPRNNAPRLGSLSPPDEGIPYVPVREAIEERPSQQNLGRDTRKADLPPLAPPPKKKGLVPLGAPIAAASAPAPAPVRANPAATAPAPIPVRTNPAATAPAPAPVRANPAATAKAPPPVRSAPDPGPQPSAGPKRKSTAPPKEGARRKSTRPPQNSKHAPPPAARPSRRPDDLSDERLRQLYAQYIEVKRSRQESTAALTYDSLAKSLLESSEKLKEKHAGKKVDFEVAVKDGKTILRPVVKDKG